MNVTSLGFTLSERDAVDVWVSRSAGWMCLVIETEGAYSEIRMDRVHVRALSDQLPKALADMDRWHAEDDACAKAETARRHAVDVAARALDLAAEADEAGVHDQATALREAAEETTTKAEAVDEQVRAFENATGEADYAVDKLLYAMSQAGTALRQLPDHDKPATRTEVSLLEHQG